MVSRVPPRPAGKRPNYALRRVVVLGAALLTIALIVWGLLLFVQWVGAQVAAKASPTPTVKASATPTGHPGPCPAASVQFTLTAPAARVGEPVAFGLKITNVGPASCTLDANGSKLVLEVSSGSDPIWSSRHCAPAPPLLLLLGPGDATQRTITWDGKRSAEGCKPVEGQVAAGNYTVTATHLGAPVAGGSAPFSLQQPPPPTP